MSTESSTSEVFGDSPTHYKVLKTADFDPKLRWYWFVQVAGFLILSIVGVVILPVWFLGLGQLWTKRLFASMAAELTEKSLNYRKGIFFKVEKTIPLEQIQDLTIREGPLLNALGICSLSLETAGQNVSGGGVARLIGIRDARDFRNTVLSRRDEIKAEAWAGAGAHHAQPESTAPGGDSGRIVEVLEQLQEDVAAIRESIQARSKN